jgi:hypothetical protein
MIGGQNDAKEAGGYTRSQEEAAESEDRDASIFASMESRMGYVNVVYCRYHPALDQSLEPFHSSTDGSSNGPLNFERRSESFVPYSKLWLSLLCSPVMRLPFCFVGSMGMRKMAEGEY